MTRRSGLVVLAIVAALVLIVLAAATADARPAPAQTRITVVDTTGGALPVTQAAAAWSKNTDVTLTVAASCGTGPCFIVQWENGQCPTGLSPLAPVAGCAGGSPCQVYVDPAFANDYWALRVVTHELGHCLGLGHNTTDRRSIMQPSPNVESPDAGDRGAVRAIW